MAESDIERLDKTMQRLDETLGKMAERQPIANRQESTVASRLTERAGEEAIDVAGTAGKAYAKSKFAGFMGGTAMAAGFAGGGLMWSALKGLLGGMAFSGGKRLLGGGSGVEKELAKQTSLLASLVVAQRATGKSVQQQMVAASFRANPLATGMMQEEARMMNASTLATDRQVGRASRTTASRLRAQQARQARIRSAEGIFPEWRTGLRDIGTEFNIARNDYNLGLSGDINTTDRAFGQFRTQLGRGVRQTAIGGMTGFNTGGGVGGALMGMIGGWYQGSGGQPSPSSAMTRVQEGVLPGVADVGTAASRNLARLNAQGPGIIGGNADTVRAGTVGEYNWRVNQQRGEENRERTRVWQDEVLDTLRRMLNEGEAQPQDYFNAEVGFGRNRDMEAMD